MCGYCTEDTTHYILRKDMQGNLQMKELGGIRPLAIDAKTNIPVPAIVLGAIGGVFALGILSLILGPILFAILITVWRDVTGVG